MNYIKQINAFYYQIEINPLSSSAIALWHALVHINNKNGQSCPGRGADIPQSAKEQSPKQQA